MNIREILQPHSLLAVIHVRSAAQALHNLGIAYHADADGAFLISHGHLGTSELRDLHDACRKSVRVIEGGRRRFFLGCNFLSAGPVTALHVAGDMQGLWLDNGLHTTDPEAPERLRRARAEAGFRGALFGGVFFKGQQVVMTKDEDFELICERARTCMDVVTTSGPGTGFAPKTEKVQRVRNAIGDFPLAIASGMDAGNIGPFLPLADYFLVSSGIETEPGSDELDPGKTRRLAEIIHAAR